MTTADTEWSFASWISGSEFQGAVLSLTGGDARGASVLAGSTLEDLLTRLISEKLAENGDPETAERLDYSTKCSSAREMQLISERMLLELRTLGRVRNEFAHNPSPDLDFDSPDIASAVERLRSPSRAARGREIAGVGTGVGEALEKALLLGVTGRRYWWTVAVLSVMAILAARLDALSI